MSLRVSNNIMLLVLYNFNRGKQKQKHIIIIDDKKNMETLYLYSNVLPNVRKK